MIALRIAPRFAGALAAMGLSAGSGAAGAQSQDPWSFSATLASDHRSKGASKTGGRPQAAVGAERALRSSGYLAGSASTIRNSAGSDAQIDLSAGWRPEAFGLAWELDSTHEFYPGSDASGNHIVWQLSLRASRKAGPVSTTLVLQHQPDGLGGTGANTYLALGAGWRLRPRLNAVAGLGRREQDGSVDYTAWNAGLVLRLIDGVALDARWYATDQDARGPNYQDRLAAALIFDF